MHIPVLKKMRSNQWKRTADGNKNVVDEIIDVCGNKNYMDCRHYSKSQLHSSWDLWLSYANDGWNQLAVKKLNFYTVSALNITIYIYI